MPVLAPMTAAGLPRRALSGNGREAQSSAFLSWPGIDELYSGVLIRTASADASAARRRRHGVGGAAAVVVVVVGGEVGEPGQLDELRVGRQQPRRPPRSRAPLWEPVRRLPLMARMRSMR